MIHYFDNIMAAIMSRYVRSGSGFEIQDYGSTDPDPKEIFMDSQHCM
jgi:hypothetical protein